jgi:hypothetical protein
MSRASFGNLKAGHDSVQRARLRIAAPALHVLVHHRVIPAPRRRTVMSRSSSSCPHTNPKPYHKSLECLKGANVMWISLDAR